MTIPTVRNTDKVTEDELRGLIAERCPPGCTLEKRRCHVRQAGASGWEVWVQTPDGNTLITHSSTRITEARRRLKRSLLRYHEVTRRDLISAIVGHLDGASDYQLVGVLQALTGRPWAEMPVVRDGANRR